jgi:hypothetical protein
VADAAASLEDDAAAAVGGGAAEADATGLFGRPAADAATAGRFLIFLLAGAAGIA